MPKYLIEQYEIHSQTYRVEADNEALAIVKVFEGKAEPADGEPAYIEVANDLGLPADDYRDLAQELAKLGVDADDVIPSIRDIVQVDKWPAQSTKRGHYHVTCPKCGSRVDLPDDEPKDLWKVAGCDSCDTTFNYEPEDIQQDGDSAEDAASSH